MPFLVVIRGKIAERAVWLDATHGPQFNNPPYVDSKLLSDWLCTSQSGSLADCTESFKITATM